MTVGCLWNFANFCRRSWVVGNDNEPTGREENEENASSAEVGGGFAIDKLEYRRGSTEVYAGMFRGSSVFLTLSFCQQSR